MDIIIEASARHVHVTREHLDILYGPGYALRNKRDLSQPGEFLTEEKLTVVGPKRSIEGISILGPCRKATQVELSLTDARILGVAPPVRLSGDVAGSAAVTLIGPAGQVTLTEGAIIAKRHIHFTPKEAAELGVSDHAVVSVTVPGERGLTFGEVVIRVSENFRPRMHIDFDEANAAGISGEVIGVIRK